MIYSLFIFYSLFFHFVTGAFDLTLSEGANGTAVVDACIAKLSQGFSSSDEQLLRRIAFAETNDGVSVSTNNGGIWQLSSSKFQQTKTSLDSSIYSTVSITFGIDWTSTVESDLLKPFYSALGARLYLEVLKSTNPIPLSINTDDQALYYTTYYTSTGRSTDDFTTAVQSISSIEVCRVDSLDLVFVLDFSSSVGDDFGKMLTFVENVVNSFDIRVDGVRVGIVSYSERANIEFHLNQHNSKSNLLTAISAINYQPTRFTSTSAGLKAAYAMAFKVENGTRPLIEGVPRVAVLLTDGKSENKQLTFEEANNLHDAGIIGFAFGVAEARVDELNAIASKLKYSEYVSMFQSPEFANLHVQLSKDLCVVSPPLDINEIIIDTIAAGEIKYFNYPLPADRSGVTIKLNVTSGYCVLYASSLVQTPNEALYDLRLMTRSWADGFIDHNTLANVETATRVYIVIRAIEVTGITISAGEGDSSTVPVSIVLAPSTDLIGYRGSIVTATAYVIGRPLATVQWYTPDGSLITSSQSGGISITQTVLNSSTISSELTISGLTKAHAGLYRCYGYNILLDSSRAEFEVTLNLTVREFMAINFEGSVISSTKISLSWDVPTIPGDQVIITYFRIDILEVETGRRLSIVTSSTSTDITSLHPYFTYHSDLYTVSGNTTYSTDNTVILRTYQSVPTLPPGSLSGTAISSTSLNLSWIPPPLEGQNGVIGYYVIRMYEVETSNRADFTSNTTYRILTSLRPFYQYTFQVAAVTVSIGPFSDNYTITMPEDVPSGRPTGFSFTIKSFSINQVTVVFTWSLPPSDSINGIILHYTFTCTGVSVNEIEVNVTGTSYEIQTLDVETHYTCSICASTRLGCGPKAIIFIFTGEPGSIQTTSTATTVRLQWSPSFVGNVKVLHYLVLYQLIKTSSANITMPSAVVVINTGSTEVEYVIRMLLPATTYNIEVIAVLEDGSQRAIGDNVTAKTKDMDEYSVREYQCVLTSPDSVRCTWTRPSPLPGGYDIKEYQIAYRYADGFNYFPGFGTVLNRTTLSPDAISFNIGGLQVYAGYVIELTCVMVSTGDIDIVSITTVYVITPSDTVSGTIQDFMLHISSSEITWKPPPRADWNGVILHYNIAYRYHLVSSPTDVEYSFTQNFSVTPTANNGDPSLATDPLQVERYTFTEPFEENFVYNFTFVIVNTKGAGPPYAITVPIGESVPTGPPIDIGVESVTRTSLVIVWRPPNPINANGVITRYSLIIVRVALNYTITEQVQGTQLSYGLQGLFSNERISVIISAGTSVGFGPYSDMQYFNTLGNVPGAPLDLFGTFTSNTSVNVLLTWNRPSFTDGVITGYQITYEGHNRQIDDTPETGPFTLTTTQTELLITRLFRGYYYVFEVRARNTAGYGASSSVVMFTPETFNNSPGGVGRRPNTTELIFIILLAILCGILFCIICIMCIICCWKYCCKKKTVRHVPSINGSIDSACLKTVTLNSADFYGHYKVDGGGTLDRDVIIVGEGNDLCPCEEDNTPAHHETTFIYEKCDSSRSPSPNIAIIHSNGPGVEYHHQNSHQHEECGCDDKLHLPSPSNSITISANIEGSGFHAYNDCDNILINTGDTDVHIHTGTTIMRSPEIYPPPMDPPDVIITTSDVDHHNLPPSWSPGHDHLEDHECPCTSTTGVIPTPRESSPVSRGGGNVTVTSYSLPRNAKPMKVSRENVALGTTRRAQTLQAPRSNYTFTRSSENIVGRSQSLRERPMYSVTRIRSSENLPSTSPARLTATVLSDKAPSPTQARRVRVQEDYELNSLTISNRDGRIELKQPRRAHSMRSPGTKKYGRSQYV